MTDWEELNPSKIAIAGDWHGWSTAAIRGIEYAAEQGAQAILHVGDFAYRFDPKFMARVQKTLERTGLVLGFVDGNHDDHSYLVRKMAEHGSVAIPLRPSIFYLPRTYRWEWSGSSFLALGGAHSVDRPWRTIGREWWPGETITIAQAQRATDDGLVDVMITHDVPAGVRIPCIEGNPLGFPACEIEAAEQHRELLRRVVDQVQPKALFAGHYHCRLTTPLNDSRLGYRTMVTILADDSAPVTDNMVVFQLA